MYMVKFIRGKDTGKTKELLKACAEVDGLFVCKHPERVDDKCRAYGLPLVRAIGYEMLNLVDTENENIFIDEAGELLKYNYPTLKGYSLTVE